jgi:L-gulonate 5-dehydrogenase
MLSVVVERPRQVALVERSLPEPGAGELRVRVRYAGICGSDVHILHGDNPFVVYPRVIGHEFVGTVDSVGADIALGRIGERVAVDPVIGCGRCYPCSLGRSNVCRDLQVLGVHRDGGFSQWQCVPARNAHPVPATLSEEATATIEPFAIAANVTSRTGVLPGDVALVYGAGPIGLCVLQVLKGVYGVRVLVTDRIPERLALARLCGADEVIDGARETLPDALPRLGVAGGPSLVIDAVCHPSILEEAIRIASPAGRIGLLSFSSAPSAISQQEVTRKELSLHASRLNSAMFPRVIEWMSRGLLQPERLITHRLDFREVERAFELLEGEPNRTCKVLLDFGNAESA